jgi:hypothetical protein
MVVLAAVIQVIAVLLLHLGLRLGLFVVIISSMSRKERRSTPMLPPSMGAQRGLAHAAAVLITAFYPQHAVIIKPRVENGTLL